MTIDKLYLDGKDIQELYGFLLKWRTLSAPNIKSNYKAIIGMQGDLDLTESLGDVFYENRVIDMGMKHPDDNWYADYESLMNEFHGKDVHIKFENDPDWYWAGRISIGGYSARNHDLSMTASVFPFKLAETKTVISLSVDAENEAAAETIFLPPSRLKVSPKFTATTENGLTVKWGTSTASVSAGSHYVDGLTVGASGLTIKVWGTGTMQIDYRVGSL